MASTAPPTPPTPPSPSQDLIADLSGRVELAPGSVPADNRFTNDDLLPVPLERRNWTTYNFAALWVGMAHNIPSWLLASGLVALGMDWKQAVFTIALANLIVLGPMLLTGHAGTQVRHPVPRSGPRLLRPARRQSARADPRRGGLRLVRHPDLDRRRRHLHAARQDLRRLGERRRDRRAAVDALALLRPLLGARTRHHLPGDGHPAPVRELGGAVRHRRRAGAADLDRRQGRRLRPAARPAVEARLGRGLLAGLLPVPDGHDRLLVHAVAQHPRLHPLRRRPTRPGLGPVAGPADHDDPLRAALGPRHLRLAGRVRRGDLGPGRSSSPRPTTSSVCSSPW